MASYNGVSLPAGLTQQVGSGSNFGGNWSLNPTSLYLDRRSHGELVWQSWYAWVEEGEGTPPRIPPVASTFTLLTTTPPTPRFQTVPIPFGTQSATLYVTGLGGNGARGSNVAPNTGGGGGGGAGAMSVVSVASGAILTASLAVAGQRNWVSLSGSDPATDSDGAAAMSGQDAVPSDSTGSSPAGGMGGLAIGSVGQQTRNGGNGYNGVSVAPGPTFRGGGGGGGAIGGQVSSGTNGTAGGVGGNLGGGGGGSTFTFSPGLAGTGGTGGGGGGGVPGGIFPPTAGGTGDGGIIRVDFSNEPADNYTDTVPVVTVIEYYRPPPPPPDDQAARLSTFNVGLPRLSPDAILALRDLLRRVQGSQEP